MSLATRLKASVSESFLGRTSAMLDELGPADDVREHIRGYAERRGGEIRELADALSDPEDEVELYRSAGFLWLELKTEWVRYNQTMQYQVARRGEAETTVFAKGAVCAELIASIEPLLVPADVELLTNLSAEPLEFGKPDVEQVRRLLSHQDRVMSQIGRIFASASAARKSAFANDTMEATRSFAAELLPGSLTSVALRYERLLGDLLRETEEALVLPHELLLPAYKLAIEQLSNELGRRVQIVTDAPESVPIDMRIARSLEDCVARAARAVIERTPQGLEAQPTVQLKLSTSASATCVTVECDRQTGPLSEVAFAELEEQAARIGAHVTTALAPESDRVAIVFALPRLSGGNPFVTIPGAKWPVCALASSVTVVEGPVLSFVDVRADRNAAPGCFLRVEFPNGETVTLGCDGAPEVLCGLMLPSGAAPVAGSGLVDFCVLTAHATFGVLTERCLDGLRAAAICQEAA